MLPASAGEVAANGALLQDLEVVLRAIAGVSGQFVRQPPRPRGKLVRQLRDDAALDQAVGPLALLDGLPEGGPLLHVLADGAPRVDDALPVFGGGAGALDVALVARRGAGRRDCGRKAHRDAGAVTARQAG